MKVRIKFTKQGTMKFIGHLDIMRYFQKVMRRAGVDIRYSEGFSPHQVMSFASPLGVGMTSSGEYVDIEVLSTDSSKTMVQRLNEAMVEGMRVVSYRRLPDQAANAMSVVAAADYTVAFREGKEPPDWDVFSQGLAAFLGQPVIMAWKKSKKGGHEVDIRPMIYGFKVRDDHRVWLRTASGSAANLKPEVALQAYMDYLGMALADFALLINREEIYADVSAGGGEPDLKPLEAFGEDIG